MTVVDGAEARPVNVCTLYKKLPADVGMTTSIWIETLECSLSDITPLISVR